MTTALTWSKIGVPNP